VEEGEVGDDDHREGSPRQDGDVGAEDDYCREQRPPLPLPPPPADDGRVDDITGSKGWDADSGSDADEEDSQAWTSKLRRVSLYLPLPLSHKDTKDKERKRMSLPSLKGMWPQSSRNSIQSTPAG
jgi:hypothetical protein